MRESSSEAELVGQVIADRYDILALIGMGGMGAVYRARDRELDELVALKVIRSELAEDESSVERFRHEVKLARRVTHANVARTFELGHANGLVFCTMELIVGESLTQRLARHRWLSVAEATTIACAVCDALAAAHSVDVIHRDIKPDNVLITTAGRVVLADFGIASIRIDDGGDLSGTPAYMAPEQARGEPPTPATDVYAVGVLLHEMVTGTRAFSGDAAQIFAAKRSSEPLTLAPITNVDAKLAEVITAATAPDVTRRIPTATALRAQLAGWASPSALEPVDRASSAGEVRTVIVLAPTTTDDASRLYLADAVHEQLLHRLSRRPRMRVLPRVGPTPEPGATIVALHASDVLALRVTLPDGGEALTMKLPLVVTQIDEAAEAAAVAITGCVVTGHARSNDPASEALDLLMQARHIGQRDVVQVDSAIERLERANQLLPDDPRIAASLAIMQVRRAFFRPDVSADLIASSAALVASALEGGPRLAEAHLAAGHLELNVGEASVAAGHYRVAIACSPHLAEAHESLGRMLLEAGFLEAAFARLDEAIAIAPSLNAVRFDIARAHALEGRWVEHDQVMADLAARNFGKPVRSGPLRLRFAAWRGDRAALRMIRAEVQTGFDSSLLEASLAVFLDGAWPEKQASLVAHATDRSSSVRRRRAFIAQLVAEIAGAAQDAATCLAMIERAVDEGLFDLHWLDRCPLLALVRGTRELAAHRIIVKRRADAVLDALYGDHDVGGLSDTVAASLPASVAGR